MFHKEGHLIILYTFLLIALITVLVDFFIENQILKYILQIFCLLMLILILQFFRNPKRKFNLNPEKVLSPVDGKIVAIEEVFENEYFNDKRLQVSIFMSPINVHVTRYPIGGEVLYSKYHPGKYLVAWHPKSSEKNERTTIVISNKNIGKILYRQIAGLLARRIINYAKVEENVFQGNDAGFIKFGSRVDLFLPIGTKIITNIGNNVKGGQSIIARY